jgi:hypothetical protein
MFSRSIIDDSRSIIDDYRSIIDDSRSINDTSRVIKMTTVSEATTWSVTYDHHSDICRGAIYDRTIFIIQAIGNTVAEHSTREY